MAKDPEKEGPESVEENAQSPNPEPPREEEESTVTGPAPDLESESEPESPPEEDAEEKTIQMTAPEGIAGEDATVIHDGEETRMGDVPDMEMLALGARLVVLSSQNHGEEHFLTSQEMVIGRAEGCDLKMDYPGVSRRHFRVFFEDGKFMIEDVGSKYGTLVGKSKVEEPRPLKHGDVIQVGELTLRFQTAKGGMPFLENKTLLIPTAGLAALVLIVLLFKLMSGGTPPPPSDTPPAESRTPSSGTPAIPRQSADDLLFKAKSLAAEGDLEAAITKLQSVLQVDPENEEAARLKTLWQDQLLLSNRLERATGLLEVGSLEQAKMLCREILADHPDNERAQKLLTRIDMLGRSQEAMAILKEARRLIEQGQYQDAEAIVSRIDNPELKTEVDEVLKQIETSKQVKQTLKEARALYREGKLEEALTRAREGLKADFRNQDIKALKKEIETVAELREKADRFLSGPTPFKAHEPLKKIIEMVGEGHPLGQSAAGDLAFLEAESAILAHAAYQNALKKLADDNLKEAMQQLDQLVMDFPQYPYFRTVRDEVNVRVDNLAKSMYRAGYVLESKDPLKAKEIWSRLMGYLPEDHPYAKKIKAKIRF